MLLQESQFYFTPYARFTLKFGSPVFYRALPSYLSEDLERLQKRAMKISPELSYAKALKSCQDFQNCMIE